MKKLLFLLLWPAMAMAQDNKAAKGFTVKGNIAGLKDSTFIFLSNPLEENKVVATAYSKKGAFFLFGNVENPDMYVINFVGYPAMKDLFLENANYTVSGEANQLQDIRINGGVMQKDYAAFTQKFDPVKNQLNSLAATINATPASPSRDSMIQVFEQGKQQVVNMVGEYVKAKPASPVSAYVLFITSPVNPNMQLLQQQFNQLDEKVKQTHHGRQLNSYLAQSSIGMEGTQAVDFTQNDTANKPVSLSSLKGKYVLVDFWASWCGPCRHENPNVVSAFNRFKDKNFTVLGVSLDRSRDRWLEAIKVDKLTWTHVSDLKFWENEVAKLYKITGIPANFLVDPDGKIVARNLRGEELHNVLQQVIK